MRRRNSSRSAASSSCLAARLQARAAIESALCRTASGGSTFSATTTSSTIRLVLTGCVSRLDETSRRRASTHCGAASPNPKPQRSAAATCLWPGGEQHRSESEKCSNSPGPWISGLRQVARPRRTGGAPVAQSKGVLVLTFNSTLTHYLRDLAARRCRDIGASLNQITFTHLHELCSRAVDDSLAGAQPAINPLPGVLSYWEAKIDQGIEAYRLGYGPRFDAVLVDEGQDFSLKWWNILRQHVRRPDGEMLLVADPMQDVYGKRAWTDESACSVPVSAARGPSFEARIACHLTSPRWSLSSPNCTWGLGRESCGAR